MIQSGTKVPANAVRIEEMVNYFDYQYKQPKADVAHPFAVQVDSVSCPWNADNKLVRVALQGKDVVRAERPASNLVFLLDVSGSMNATDKLPLLKSSLKYLLEEMDERVRKDESRFSRLWTILAQEVLQLVVLGLS